MSPTTTLTRTAVCAGALVQPGRGVAALLPGGRQVAIFRTAGGVLYGVSNIDPFSGAAVLSRGIVGDRGGIPVVVSPMHKQAFALATGICLDDPEVRVEVFMVAERDGVVEVAGG
jgi:nitrite reductase (NADH) small subunit